MKIFFLSISIFLYNSAWGQIAWEKPFGTSHRAALMDIVHMPGDCIYACGSDTVGPVQRAYLIKFDAFGNVLWEKKYSVADSNYKFDKIIMFNNGMLLQAASIPKVNGVYFVPKIILMDTSGVVVDSTWPDISDVYNSTANMGIYPGPNQTFWNIHYIGTIGISNFIRYTRYNATLDTLSVWGHSAFYYSLYSFNKQGEHASDIFIDEWDSTSGQVTNPDHVALWNYSGSAIFDSAYFTLPMSDNILMNEDHGFTLFYELGGTLEIKHFDANGVMQWNKNYNLVMQFDISNPIAAADNAYFLNTSNPDHRVFKISENDDTLWSQSFNAPDFSYYITLRPALDNGAVAIFRTFIYGSDSINYIVRLGPNGERHPFNTSATEVDRKDFLKVEVMNDLIFLESLTGKNIKQLFMYDANSRLIMRKEINATISHVDISSIQPGVYFIRCESDDAIVNRKILKVR